MYILLHGAKRNVGDFLIFERSKELIKTHCKTEEFLEIPRWQSLTPYLNIVNKSKGIFLCGGPGYADNFYPGIFPLIPDLSKLQVPIIPLGLGWGVGNNPTKARDFQFTQSSLDAIEKIHREIPYSSVRDVLTEQIIKSTGITNVVTTGCPAWYYLPYVDKDFSPPKRIRRIVISTPAQARNFTQIKKLILLVEKLFPKADRYLVFHRGIFPGKHASMKEVMLNSALATVGLLSGNKVVDAAYSTHKIEFYKDCDLHIGYRVHAHIDFLSLRKPSILLQEDARGVGQSKTLHTLDVNANDINFARTVENLLVTHLDTRFQAFHRTIAIMQTTYKVMSDFLELFR